MSMVKILPPDEAKKMEGYHNMLAPMLSGMPAQGDIPETVNDDPMAEPDF